MLNRMYALPNSSTRISFYAVTTVQIDTNPPEAGIEDFLSTSIRKSNIDHVDVWRDGADLRVKIYWEGQSDD